ncbi:MAG: hypothetical protein LBU65_09330 [Planctomycetaceae bacterium]|jgi:hypothetical protein|nr:hypothetical protein [Planctomycetaceae bacterium]
MRTFADLRQMIKDVAISGMVVTCRQSIVLQRKISKPLYTPQNNQLQSYAVLSNNKLYPKGI